MQVQVHTDNHIEGHEQLVRQVEIDVSSILDRFADQITRVEVHLSDENGPKSTGDDKRCLLEARLRGLQPIPVTHHAATLELAVGGAADKLEKVLDRTLSKLRDPKGRPSYGDDQTMS